MERLKTLLTERRELLGIIGLLAAGFLVVAVVGFWGLLHVFSSAQTMARQEVSAEAAAISSAMRVDRDAQTRQIVPVPHCKLPDSWSAFPENSLSVERVYAFPCGGKIWLMLPEQMAVGDSVTYGINSEAR